MQPAHVTQPRGRSAFAAAFLSLIFPGLGQVYLGAYRRGLGWAAPPLLLGALLAGFAVRIDRTELLGFAVQSWFQVVVFIGNLVLLAYRAAAIVDAWLIARAVNGSRTPPTSGPPSPVMRTAGILSIAGLAAVVLVMSTIHLVVARYDVLLSTTVSCVFGGGDDSDRACQSGDTPEPGDDTQPPSGPADTPPATVGPPVTEPTLQPWNGKDRLNILLIGADEQNGGHNTDTMITVSIDPTTNQAVMFQLPRDTVDVPLPPGPVRNAFGSIYSGKINSLFSRVRHRSDLFPGTGSQPGYNGLKATLGYLYGLDIRYYVEVNFDGFKKVVDALGGVTVNVQIPVEDDDFPRAGGTRERLYIPAGIQHMTGQQALDYARSRKSTSDFDRGARQQRVLVSLRQQADIGAVLRNIDPIAQAIGSSVRTDIPPELVPQLLSLADKIDLKSIRSVIFTPPYYQTECLNCPPRGYIIQPRVSRIRAAVQEAFSIDPNFAEQRDALAQEGAAVWVLNGSGQSGQASRLSDYLTYLGIASTAPVQKPDVNGLPTTTVRAYNGAETQFPLTAQALATVFGVTVQTVSDPAVRADFVVITGGNTPSLTAPPAP